MGASATARTSLSADRQRSVTIYELIAANKRRSWLLLSSFIVPIAGLAVGVQAKFQNITLTAVVLIWSVVMLAMLLAGHADQAILASLGAKPADPKFHAHFINCVEGLAIAAGIPTPRTLVINSNRLNAFAIGYRANRTVICATTGLLRLRRLEVEGVVAHETAHIMCRDTQYTTLSAYCVLVTQLLARFVLPRPTSTLRGSRVFAIFAVSWTLIIAIGGCCDNAGTLWPLVAILALLCLLAVPIIAPKLATHIDRNFRDERELLADANGALLCRYHLGLAAALERISQNAWIPPQLCTFMTPLLTVSTEATRYSIWGSPSEIRRSRVDTRILRLRRI